MRVQAMKLPVTAVTVSVLVRACLTAGDLDQAMAIYTVYKDDHRVLPTLVCFNAMISALGRAGRLADVAAVTDTLVGAGVRVTTGTFDSILNACQLCGAHELAFQVCLLLTG